jgi:hypothetical protein
LSSKVRDLRLFAADHNETVIINQKSIICVELDGFVKEYDEDGSREIGKLDMPLSSPRSHIVACDGGELRVVSSNGRLVVFSCTSDGLFLK